MRDGEGNVVDSLRVRSSGSTTGQIKTTVVPERIAQSIFREVPAG